MKNAGHINLSADYAARVASFFLRLISPPKCVICEALLEKESELCPRCNEIFARAENRRCPICHSSARACTCRPYSMFETDDIGNCKILALAFFAPPDSTDFRDIAVRRFVYNLKRSSDRSSVKYAARQISIELLRLFAKNKIDKSSYRITYPPREKKQINKYGFDQSYQIAKAISKYTAIPFMQTLDRKRGSSMQKTLNAAERKINADKTYTAQDGSDFTGINFIICDDVITTGATVSACAAILKACNAKTVFPVCVARTKRKKRSAKRAPSRKPWFLK